jgi:hypothetical protein
VGFISGPIAFLPNVSKNGSLVFGPKQSLKANGSIIQASDGGPCVADWDGDGEEDLLLGNGEGGVTFYKASWENGQRVLAAGQPLVKPLGPNAWQGVAWKDEATQTPGVTRSGVRAKPCVADWNGDGKLDLIVGDYTSIKPRPKNLTAAEQKKAAALEKEQQQVQQQFTKAYEETQRATYKEMGLKYGANIPANRRKEFQERQGLIYARNKELRRLSDRTGQLYSELRRYRNYPQSAGFVWVYLRT